MSAFSIDPPQLTAAAAEFGALAAGATGESALRYWAWPPQLGAEPLVSALDAFQNACSDAMSVLAADLAATEAHLLATAQRYVYTDAAVATAIAAH